MTTPPSVTYTIEEFLTRFEQKIDRQFTDLKAELKQEIAAVRQDMAQVKTELKQEIAEVKQEVKEARQEVKEVNQKVSDLSGDVKALDVKVSGVENTLGEKIKGIDKRLENLEFIVRGGLVAFLTGFVGLILKVFGAFPNIKPPLG